MRPPTATGGPRISTGSGPTAWVIPTNEELVIAQADARRARRPRKAGSHPEQGD